MHNVLSDLKQVYPIAQCAVACIEVVYKVSPCSFFRNRVTDQALWKGRVIACRGLKLLNHLLALLQLMCSLYLKIHRCFSSSSQIKHV